MIRCLMFLISLLAVPVRAAEFGVVTKLDQGLTGLGQIVLIRQAGVTLNRDSVTWSEVETVRGTLGWPADTSAIYAALKQNGIRTVVVLRVTNPLYDNGRFPTTAAAIAAYARFAGHSARMLRGQTVAFEIGNEWRPGPSVSGRQTTMVDYVNLFVAAARAIRAADADAKIVADPAIFAAMPVGPMPSASSTIGAAAQRGLAEADGVVVHQYPYQFANMTVSDAQNFMDDAMRERADWLERLAGRPVPLYVTEYGWPQITARGLTAREQAAQMAETTRRFAAMPFVRIAIAYELIDSCNDERNSECTFGLFDRGANATISAKPGLSALRDAVVAAAR
jgi:polysaccharide biosynthesis protein PslG